MLIHLRDGTVIAIEDHNKNLAGCVVAELMHLAVDARQLEAGSMSANGKNRRDINGWFGRILCCKPKTPRENAQKIASQTAKVSPLLCLNLLVDVSRDTPIGCLLCIAIPVRIIFW